MQPNALLDSNETRQKHHGMNMSNMVGVLDLREADDAEGKVALPRRRAGPRPPRGTRPRSSAPRCS